jgi:hypothetical protein
MIKRSFSPGTILACLASLGFAGCGGNSLPPPADAEQARAALRSALDAWKKGDRPDALNKLSPAVYVSDVDWRDGYGLQSFEIGAKDEQSGLSRRCRARLDLKHPRGETMQKYVVYMIETQSVISIVREDR